ncbi:oligosaccharide flippase family protein [Pseudoxanthomonas suwonensis]|uniref:oligosaccharide flippase family protein n=1 Tax=Pseudoxanthomonas suwonensis TaxID=314722 RepID=UPI00130E28C6|nr:oligosaccharide flippase family protein [Pseudoxanthomonas suwonensis]
MMAPYLARTLGLEAFGILALGLALVQAGSVVVDYGFNLSATHRIATSKDNKRATNQILGAVTACKTVLLLIVCLSVVSYLLLFPDSQKYAPFFLLMLIPLAGQTYQPVWFYQGIELMRPLTLYTIGSRLIFLCLTVLLVHAPTDLIWVALANGIGHLAAAAAATYTVLKLGYRYKWPSWRAMKAAIRESTPFFWSRAAVMTYTSGATLALGAFAGAAQVAQYSAAEQIYRGLQALFSPIPQALYPNMAKERNLNLFATVLKGTICLSIVAIAAGILVGEWLLVILFGEEFRGSYSILVVFMGIYAVTMPSMLLGYPLLGAFGKLDIANRTVLLGGILQVLCLIVVYISGLGALAVATSILLVELSILCFRAYYAASLYRKYFAQS